MPSSSRSEGSCGGAIDDLLALDLTQTRTASSVARLLSLAADYLDADDAFLCVGDGDYYFDAEGIGPPADGWNRRAREQVAHRVITSGGIVILENSCASDSSARASTVEVARCYSAAAMPIRSAADSVIGSMSILDHQARHWRRREIDALGRFAAVASAELQMELELHGFAAQPNPSSSDWQQALTSAPFFRALVERNLVGIGVMRDDAFVYVNPRLAEIFGYTPEEMVRSVRPLDVVVEDERGIVRENLRRRLAGEVETLKYRFSGLYRDGSVTRVEVQGSRIDLGGEPVVLATAIDVAEQESALAAANRAIQARDDVMAVVSHDLRNSLHSIRLSTEMLAGSSEALPPAGNTAIRIVRRAATEMNRIIQDLLDLASIDSGRFTIAPEPTDVRELLGTLEQLLRPIADQEDVELTVESSGAPRRVAVDRSKLLRVLSNLVGNGIKFCGSGGRVSVAADASEERLRFKVFDSGPGIPAEELPHVFDRFWQAKPGDHRGLGLGLAIAKGIVEAHGGTISVTSEQGVGCTFTFTIPLPAG